MQVVKPLLQEWSGWLNLPLAVRNPTGSGTGWHSSPATESHFLQQGSTPYSLIASQARPPTGNQCSNTWGCGEHSTFKRHWLPNSEKHMSVSYELPSLWYSSNINGLIQNLTITYFVLLLSLNKCLHKLHSLCLNIYFIIDLCAYMYICTYACRCLQRSGEDMESFELEL